MKVSYSAAVEAAVGADQVVLTVPLFLFSHPAQAGAEISTVNPEQYSKRFLDFIGHILT